MKQEGIFMNNGDLADSVAAAHWLTKADARKIVDEVFTAIADAAAKGDEISLMGSGSSGSRTARRATATIRRLALPFRSLPRRG
jgi:nucleoid DNA-binding protein